MCPKRLYGDSLRLSQILNNLLSNAVKFTQSGEVILIISRIEENIFRFEVKDTGIGLKREEQKKIFNAFSQADGKVHKGDFIGGGPGNSGVWTNYSLKTRFGKEGLKLGGSGN